MRDKRNARILSYSLLGRTSRTHGNTHPPACTLTDSVDYKVLKQYSYPRLVYVSPTDEILLFLLSLSSPLVVSNNYCFVESRERGRKGVRLITLWDGYVPGISHANTVHTPTLCFHGKMERFLFYDLVSPQLVLSAVTTNTKLQQCKSLIIIYNEQNIYFFLQKNVKSADGEIIYMKRW